MSNLGPLTLVSFRKCINLQNGLSIVISVFTATGLPSTSTVSISQLGLWYLCIKRVNNSLFAPTALTKGRSLKGLRGLWVTSFKTPAAVTMGESRERCNSCNAYNIRRSLGIYAYGYFV